MKRKEKSESLYCSSLFTNLLKVQDFTEYATKRRFFLCGGMAKWLGRFGLNLTWGLSSLSLLNKVLFPALFIVLSCQNNSVKIQKKIEDLRQKQKTNAKKRTNPHFKKTNKKNLSGVYFKQSGPTATFLHVTINEKQIN